MSLAATLAALHAQAFPEDPWGAKSFETLLALPGMHAFLDQRGGFLILRIVLDEAEIITIGVLHRRQGIATALLTRAITTARQAGVAKIHLEVADQNHAARALYAAQNFYPTGRRKSYYPDGTDALTLTLDLR